MNEQFEKTRQYWGGAVRRGNLIYPNDQVIRFIKRNYRNNKEITILDFGCGGGRNAVALLNEGYKVIAMDYTDDAVEMTKEKYEQYKINDGIVIKNTGFNVPLLNDSVDVVIADGSLFYYSKQDIVKTVSNLKSVMKTGGLLWTDFRTKHDSLFGRGEFIEDGLYKLGSGTDREECSYYFAEEDDVRDIFNKAELTIISLDDFTYSENNRKIINSWYHVVAKKEG